MRTYFFMTCACLILMGCKTTKKKTPNFTQTYTCHESICSTFALYAPPQATACDVLLEEPYTSVEVFFEENTVGSHSIKGHLHSFSWVSQKPQKNNWKVATLKSAAPQMVQQHCIDAQGNTLHPSLWIAKQ
jgi:hypothetical protein